MHQWHPFIINTNWHNERLNFMQMSRDAIGVLFTTALAKRSSLPAEKKSSTALQKKLNFYRSSLQEIKCFLSCYISAVSENTFSSCWEARNWIVSCKFMQRYARLCVSAAITSEAPHECCSVNRNGNRDLVEFSVFSLGDHNCLCCTDKQKIS